MSGFLGKVFGRTYGRTDVRTDVTDKRYFYGPRRYPGVQKSKKSNEAFWRNFQKTRFSVRFWPFGPVSAATRIFEKNPALSLLSPYGPITSCKKSEKTNERFSWKIYVRTDGRTDGRTDKHYCYGPRRYPGVQKSKKSEKVFLTGPILEMKGRGLFQYKRAQKRTVS